MGKSIPTRFKNEQIDNYLDRMNSRRGARISQPPQSREVHSHGFSRKKPTPPEPVRDCYHKGDPEKDGLYSLKAILCVSCISIVVGGIIVYLT